MKIGKKELKELFTVVKRLVKDKEKSRISIQKTGNGFVDVAAKSESEKILMFVSYPDRGDDEEEAFAFQVNPFELEAAASEAKLAELDFKVNKKSMRLIETEKTLKIAPIDPFKTYSIEAQAKFQEPEPFVGMLKEAEVLLKKSKETSSDYMKIAGQKALVLEERQVHLYSLNETFGFNDAHIHKDAVAFLSKTLKKDFTHGYFNGAMALKQKDFLFLIKINEKIQFPNLRNLKTLDKMYAFKIDAEKMTEKLKEIKKEHKNVSTLQLAIEGEKIAMTLKAFKKEQAEEESEQFPLDGDAELRTEESRTYEVDGVQAVENGGGKAVFHYEVLLGMFGGYKGSVSVEHRKFKNVYGAEGYMWRIYSPEKVTMASGVSEPDWEEIRKAFSEGRISELEKQIRKGLG